MRRGGSRAEEPCTGARERRRHPAAPLTSSSAAAPYPDGLLGFVLDAPSVLTRPASFTPFHTGSLQKYAVPMDPTCSDLGRGGPASRSWSITGPGSAVASFAGPYLSAHFPDADDATSRASSAASPISRPITVSQCTSGDRRDWTMEVQVHEDVRVRCWRRRCSGRLSWRGRPLIEDLPEDFGTVARLVSAEDEVLETHCREHRGAERRGAAMKLADVRIVGADGGARGKAAFDRAPPVVHRCARRSDRLFQVRAYVGPGCGRR